MSAALDESRGASTSRSIWEETLSSVGTSRSIPTKTLLVLGEHDAGKSTLISHLANSTGEQGTSKSATARPKPAPTSSDIPSTPGLGLTYSHIDVSDEGDEETVARLGIYQLASSTPSFATLLPLALNPSTLLDSLIVIVLDWAQPWTFLESLCAWLAVLKRLIAVLQAQKDPASGAQYALDEGRERVEAVWRSYAEPVAKDATASTSLAATARPTAADEPLPLPQGTLTDNVGLSIVCVCTKSDLIDTLERDKDFKEEQFDYIQQSLRTICLQHGASLIFTSQFVPSTYQSLRSYVLHRLFASPALLHTTTSAAQVSTDKATLPFHAQALPHSSTSRTFPFTQRANVIDRDQILVPLGWDSWGKIRVLRDGFDAAAFGAGWQLDVRQACGDQVEEADARTAEGKRVVSAVRSYGELIVDHDATDIPSNAARSRIEASDEQDFLRAHYEVLQKEQTKDPRAQFQAKPSASDYEGRITSPSLVGPMASSSLNLPSVQRALERDVEESPVMSAPKPIGRDSAPLSSVGGPLSPGLALASSPPLAGAATAAAPLSPGANPPTNEVLANFFQSLLASRAGSRGGAGSPGPNRAASPSSPQINGRQTPDSGRP